MFEFNDAYPPPKTPLVLEEHAARLLRAEVKTPKLVASLAVDIVM